MNLIFFLFLVSKLESKASKVSQAQLALPDHALAVGQFPVRLHVYTNPRRQHRPTGQVPSQLKLDLIVQTSIIQPTTALLQITLNVARLIMRELCQSFMTPLLSQHKLAILIRHAPRLQSQAEVDAEAEEKRLAAVNTPIYTDIDTDGDYIAMLPDPALRRSQSSASLKSVAKVASRMRTGLTRLKIIFGRTSAQ